ncbi:OsmC family protein [Propionibacteriaceae bacterium G1746]|uniref:OsmC family protein n=1 Tax=Aestuariimicrobium sp. G57 TaxID=3418485 RepID=UPI003C170338
MADFTITISTGTLASPSDSAVRFPHRWTTKGVTVDAPFTGGHLLLLAPAACVLNDTYREADRLGITVDGVRVIASGGLDESTWHSTGITYSVLVDSPAPIATVNDLVALVDAVAEIPKALRAGTTVERVAPPPP